MTLRNANKHFWRRCRGLTTPSDDAKKCQQPQHVQASMPTPGHVGKPSMPTSSHDQVLHRQSGLDGSLHTPTSKQELLLVNHLISTAQLIPFAGTATKTGPAINIKFLLGI